MRTVQIHKLRVAIVWHCRLQAICIQAKKDAVWFLVVPSDSQWFSVTLMDRNSKAMSAHCRHCHRRVILSPLVPFVSFVSFYCLIWCLNRAIQDNGQNTQLRVGLFNAFHFGTQWALTVKIAKLLLAVLSNNSTRIVFVLNLWIQTFWSARGDGVWWGELKTLIFSSLSLTSRHWGSVSQARQSRWKCKSKL